MKKSMNIIFILLLMVTVFSCKKEENSPNSTGPTTPADNYSSVANFFAVNGSAMQTYNISGTSGGSFTTSKGTVVSIPANAFMTQSYTPVTGNVTISFKDIYKKSDMLLNGISTNMYGGGPIKSAGMFYIKAMQGTQVLQMSWSKKITVTQPLNGLPIDTAMRPLIFQWGVPGTILGGWNPAPQDSMGWPVDSLYWTLSNYIFSLYQFSAPSDSGTWSNSDNCSFFSGYPQTTLTLNPLDSYSTYYTEVFLLFSGINSMVHVYWNGTNFPYYYAPAGLQCTAVAVGVKGGKLYSSFKPLTISTNLTVNFSLSETTTADFKAQLNALN